MDKLEIGKRLHESMEASSGGISPVPGNPQLKIVGIYDGFRQRKETMTVTQEQIREASKKAGSIKKLGKEIGTSDASLYQYLKDSDRLSEDMRNKIERGVIRVLMPEPEVNMPIQAKAALQMAAGAERSIQLPEEKPLPNTIEIVRLVQREAQGIEDSSSLEEEFLDMALRVVRMAKRNRRLEAERAGINMLLGEKK